MSTARFSTGSIVKYSILPRILPRFTELFLSGFHHIAFLMAQIYGAVRLLPANHPYLRGENIGKYSIRQVIAAAAGYLSFRRENIDQIIVFFVMLGGMILLLLQTLTVLGALMMPMSFAAPPPPPVTSPLSFGHYFGQPTYGGAGPSQDLAFILLDRVFGVPGIFQSCVDANLAIDCYGTLPSLRIDTANPIYRPATFPWPFHLGLHAMLEFYSMGLLVVACFIILYFVIVIVAETAQTGTPFGKRFNTVWAPLRLVMALGLLIPITSGLNSAQYITLYMAKIGSNFASNGWIWYNSGVGSWGAAQALNLVAKPQTPEPDSLLQFLMLAHACKALEEGYLAQPKINTSGTPSTCTGIDPVDDGYTGSTVDNSENYIDAYLVKYDTTGTNDAIMMAATDYAAARTFFEGGDIVVRFGDRGCDYTTQMGRVYPTCGEVIIPMVNPSNNPSEAGATSMQSNYYETLRYLWGEYSVGATLKHWKSYEFCRRNDVINRFINDTTLIGDMELRSKAIAIVQHSICGEEGGVTPQLNLYGAAGTYTVGASDYEPLGNEDWYAHAIQHYREGEGVPVAQAAGRGYPAAVFKDSGYPFSKTVSDFNGTSELIAENIVRMGVIAQINAIVNTDEFEIVKNDPSVAVQMSQLSRGWAGAGMWYNNIARINGSVTAAAMNYPQATRMPFMMESVLTKVRQNNQNTTPQDQFNPNFGKKNAMVLKRGETETYAASILNTIYNNWLGNRNLYKPQTGNPMLDFINYIFGTKGLFNLDDPQNQVTNPLALLSSMGKAMVEASIRSLVGGTGAMAVSMAKFAGISEAADAISGILFSISTATLSAGITLYYVLPFMPFVYFFFAVGNWIKGIFEAMVGVPLWALAHIRIDGNGLPGEAAMNGYYMLFEIFLRPILILFGLIASVSIFGAMASVLNGIWPIASKNVGGANFDNSSTAGWMQAVRGPVDQLFFSVMYAVILYIMAMSSFKLIDLIPNQIMRWLGSGVSTFSDLTGDPGQSLMQYGGSIGNQISSQAVGGMQSLGQGGKALVQGTMGK